MVALLIVPIAAMLSLAGEVSGWYLMERAAQNAADSAAIAAANNNDATEATCSTGSGVTLYNRVFATATYNLNAVVAEIPINVHAAACLPKSS